MFGAKDFLTVTGVFLITIFLTLLIARFLLWIILATMQHGLHRRHEAAVMFAPTKQLVKTGGLIGKSRTDSQGR